MKSKNLIYLSGLICLLGLAFFFRYWVLCNFPELQEANYDEGAVGLQAKFILKGDFLAFWWGHPYLGASGFYWAALAFKLFSSTTFVLRMVSLLISIAGIIFSVLIAKEIFGKKWSLFTLLWWIITPAYLTRFSLTPFCYINCIAYGNIALFIAYKIFYGKDQKNHLFFLLGLFCGIALWEHLVTVSYLGAIFIFLLFNFPKFQEKKKVFLLLLIGFLIGNMPFWYWNITHNFQTITAMIFNKSASSGQLINRFDFVFLDLLTELLGCANKTFPLWEDPVFAKKIKVYIYILYAPIIIYFVFIFIKNCIVNLMNFIKRKKLTDDKLSLLLTSFVFSSLLVIITQYSKGLYLMPIYSAIPILFTAFAIKLSRISKLLPAVMILFLAGINISDNYKMYEDDIPLKNNPRPIDDVINFLKKNNITRVYAHYTTGWFLTFESNESIIASDYFGMTDHLYYIDNNSHVYMNPFFEMMNKVDDDSNIACISNDKLLPIAGALENSFDAIGATYKKQRINHFYVYYDFKMPYKTIRQIDRNNFNVEASSNHELLPDMTDRNLTTLWESEKGQSEKMFLQVNFKESVSLCKILLNPGRNIFDYPREFQMEISDDGINWTPFNKKISLGIFGIDWFLKHPKFNVKGIVGISFNPVTTKHLKINITKNAKYLFSVAEIMLYEPISVTDDLPAPHTLSENEVNEFVDLLNKEKADAFYSVDSWNIFLSLNKSKKFKTIGYTDKEYCAINKSETVIHFNKSNAFLDYNSKLNIKNKLDYYEVPYKQFNLKFAELFITNPIENHTSLIWLHDRILNFYDKEEAYKYILAGEKFLAENDLLNAEHAFVQSTKSYPFFISAYENLLKVYMLSNNSTDYEKTKEYINKNFKPSIISNAIFGEEIQLLGIDASSLKVKPGAELKISYYWKSLKQETKRNLSIFVHLEGEADMIQNDHEGMYGENPIIEWLHGEIIKENSTIKIPGNIKSKKFRLVMGIWEPLKNKRIKITQSDVPTTNREIYIADIIVE